MTYEDYYRMKDEWRYEVNSGVMYAMGPAPNRRHQKVALNLASELRGYLRGKKCEAYIAPFDVRLPEKGEDCHKASNVVQPDIVVVCDTQKLDDAGCCGAPEIVIEILSPSTARKDTLTKRELYERHGVLEYWIVDPDECTVSILKLHGERFGPVVVLSAEDGDALHSDILPELALNLRDIFELYAE